jgi:Mg2+ and Co2+ transporter CorA
MTQMDLRNVESVRSFKRSIRHIKEIFLRFTHRYWFHEISDQALARDLYRLWAGQLRTDVLYDEVRNEILDMTEYLDSDQVRRQAETVVRLTVVTVLGLIFNIVTGWFGMNLLAAADEPLLVKTVYFSAVFIPALALILYTVYKSKRLAYFLEAMADDKVPVRGKLKVFLAVWPRKHRADRAIGDGRPRKA